MKVLQIENAEPLFIICISLIVLLIVIMVLINFSFFSNYKTKLSLESRYKFW